MTDATAFAFELPSYAAMLEAYHSSFSPELGHILEGLPVRRDSRVLDVACGDGCYSRMLAQRAGKVVGLDLAASYLEIAREQASTSGLDERLVFLQGNAARMPFAADQFDVTFCAQSFGTLGDPERVLAEMLRVTKPGGVVAVLENDSLHHVLIPWPPELELAVRQAELKALAALPQDCESTRYYVARNLVRWLSNAGALSPELSSFVIARRAPLGDTELRFLDMYFADLGRFVAPHLADEHLGEFKRLLSLDSPECLFRRDDFQATYLESLAIGRKAG